MAYLCGFLSKSLNLTAACLCKFYCVFEGVPIANLLYIIFLFFKYDEAAITKKVDAVLFLAELFQFCIFF